jgi:hypothetical protein
MDPSDHDLRLRLVFRGECIQGQDPLVVRRTVATALKLSEHRAARLFSGKPIVINQPVGVRYAARQVARFAVWGAVLQVQPMPAPVRAVPTVPQRVDSPAPRAGPRWTRRGWAVATLGSATAALVLSGAWVRGSWIGDQAAGVARLPIAEPVPAPQSARPIDPASSQPEASAAAPGGGSGEADDLVKFLSPGAASDYTRLYLPAKAHRAFAVSEAGAHAWVTGAATEDLAREAALQRCMQLPGASPCRLVDVDGQQLE